MNTTGDDSASPNSRAEDEQPDSKQFMDETVDGRKDSNATGAGASDETLSYSTDAIAPLSMVEPANFRINPGSIFGRYRIEKLLGNGAMGEVFLAHDVHLDRRVALKIPQFHGGGWEETVSRFFREARAMANLHHSNLCPVYDVGQIDGKYFMSMAYIEGQTLNDRIKEKPFKDHEAIELMQKIASALHLAHEAGIVHRDLKPANVMISLDGEPVVMDFGLAQRNQMGEADLTQSGVILGTPAYMAPEQAESRHDDVGPHSDVWSMGVILYFMLTGKRPFMGSPISVMSQIVMSEPPSIVDLRADIAPALRDIVSQAMTKDISKRQASSAQMAQQLSDFLASTSRASGTAPTASISGAGDSLIGSVATSMVRRPVTVAVFSFDDPELSSDPEQQQETLSTFTNLIREHVEEFDGAVIESDDVQVITSFGFPISHEDSPVRAIRAGRQVLSTLTPESLPKLIPGTSAAATVTVIVHSGDTIAKQDVDTGAISLSGDVRSTALRLDAVAEPGNMVVSETTHQRSKMFFEWESLGASRIRGLAQPMELFLVNSEAESRSRVDLVDPGNLTPLIGRSTELNILKDRWELTLDELGQVVVLIGEAGLGKSRLIREIRNHVLEDEDEPSMVMELRCSAYHRDSSFFPIIEFIQRLLEFDQVTANSDRQTRIERLLTDADIYSVDNLGLMANLLAVELSSADGQPLPPLELPPQRLMELTQELLLKWLNGVAQKQPTLFIIEDLHWSDASTQGLLTQLVDSFSSGQLMSLLTFRPEFETPWASSPHQTQIALNRLPKRQMKKMIHERIGRKDIPDQIVNQLIDRTDGVPPVHRRILQFTGRIRYAQRRGIQFGRIIGTGNSRHASGPDGRTT